MDYLVPLIFIASVLLSLHCRGVQADPCPPFPTPTNLTEFSCFNTTQSEFPSGFPEGTRLISVEFTNLSIIGVEALRGLPKLQELHLSGNKLKTLPSGLFRDVPELQALDLTSNLLKDLPPGIFQNSTALKQLALQQNQLVTLRPSWFQTLQQLMLLDLSHNQLKDVPRACFDKLENLTSLDLSYNLLHTVSPQVLEGLPRLERLVLEGNQIQTIADKTFHVVPGLEILLLQKNHLAHLPAGIFMPLDFLELLDISGNHLTSLDPQFSGQATKLSLDLSENPWACDCRLRTLVDWVTSSSVSLYSKSDMICASPKNLEGRALMSLNETEFGFC